MKMRNFRRLAFMLGCVIMCSSISPIQLMAEDDDLVIAEVFTDPTLQEYIIPNDLNNDGILQESEIQQVKSLQISNSNVESLAGIEYLTDLVSVILINTKVKTVDVSALTELKFINLQSNSELVSVIANGSYTTSLSYSIDSNPKLEIVTFSDKVSMSGNIISTDELESHSCVFTAISGFDSSKMSNLKGATYNTETNSFMLNQFSSQYSYDYACGNGQNLKKTVKVTNVSHDADTAGVCTVCGVVDSSYALDSSHSIYNGAEEYVTYNGMYMEIDSDIRLCLSGKYDASKIQPQGYTVKKGNTVITSGSYETTYENGIRDFLIACDMAPKTLSDDLQFSFIYTDKSTETEKTKSYDISARNYIYKILESNDETCKKFHEVASALLKYSEASQVYFEYGNFSQYESNTYKTVDFSSYASTKDIRAKENATLTESYVGSSLELEHNVILNHYVAKQTDRNAIEYNIIYNTYRNDNGLSFDTYVGLAATASANGNYIKISSSPIPVYALRSKITTYFADSDYEPYYEVDYCVFSYAALVQEYVKAHPTDVQYNKVLNIMYAMHEYAIAAEEVAFSYYGTK